MKKIVMTLAALALAASAANATSILGNYKGPVVIYDDGYENIVTNVGDKLSGIFEVTSIYTVGLVHNYALWTSGKNGQELTGTFSGLTAGSITTTGGNTVIDFTGGTASMYLDSAQNFSATNAATASDGTKVLDLNFVPGINTDPADPLKSSTTFQGTLTSLTSPFSGKGFGYGAVSTTNTEGFGSTMLFSSALSAPSDYSNWPVGETGKVNGTSAVPEPGTLALLGAGMLGLIGFKRRKA